MTSKATKEKKQPTPSLHPPYLTMILEAISSLKERSKSSQLAITKYLEEKNKTHLPSNFRKMLSIQLKRFAKLEKLFKVKNSYKLSAPATKKPTTNIVVAAATPKKKVTASFAAAKKVVKEKKPKTEEKTKVKKLVAIVASKVKDGEKKKAPKPKTKATPKKTKSLKPVKTTPMKKRVVKSIKSLSKPAAAKKAKK